MMLERMKDFVTKAEDVTADARLADSRQLGFIEDASIDLLVKCQYIRLLSLSQASDELARTELEGRMDDEIGSRNKHSSKKEEIDLMYLTCNSPLFTSHEFSNLVRMPSSSSVIR